ncbi:MAG TPA: ADP-ribosylglycohydrolase family protein, partial [Tepidisphaeraceae bacterium]|nr:ADP-ribosylglycohydrolase family protein [Tepidisphaeraceae bacterium]
MLPCPRGRAVEAVVLLGGDTDSTGALVGALCGAANPAAVPNEWVRRLFEYPRSRAWMECLGARLAVQYGGGDHGGTVGPLPLNWPALAPRNLLFATTVL